MCSRSFSYLSLLWEYFHTDSSESVLRQLHTLNPDPAVLSSCRGTVEGMPLTRRDRAAASSGHSVGTTFGSLPSTDMLPGVSSVCEHEIYEFRKSLPAPRDEGVYCGHLVGRALSGR